MQDFLIKNRFPTVITVPRFVITVYKCKEPFRSLPIFPHDPSTGRAFSALVRGWFSQLYLTKPGLYFQNFRATGEEVLLIDFCGSTNVARNICIINAKALATKQGPESPFDERCVWDLITPLEWSRQSGWSVPLSYQHLFLSTFSTFYSLNMILRQILKAKRVLSSLECVIISTIRISVSNFPFLKCETST